MEQLREFWDKVREWANVELFELGDYQLTVKAIVLATAVLLLTRLFAMTIARFVLRPILRRRSVDMGRSYAVTQMILYIVYVVGVISAFSIVGIELSVLWGAAAALLVGIGLGLQQTFNDFVSGLILLVEGPVEVGNVVEVDGFIGRVVEIGLRTSKIRSRDDIMIIVPNSHLTNDNIVNWSHIRSPLRYHVTVGVAYGSDVDLVQRLLMQAASDHDDILERPAPRIMFQDFGASSLDFALYFYSQEPWRIEFVKSDVRFAIDRLFREHGVQIPFPQRDLWLRNAEALGVAHANGQTRAQRERAADPDRVGAA